MQKLRQNCEQDAQFMLLWRSGNKDAFNVFCVTYKPIIIGYLKGKCRSCDVDDVVQEVFIRCFKARASYDPEKAKLSTWLYRISKSVLIDNYRKKTCRPQLMSNVDFDRRSDAYKESELNGNMLSCLDRSEADLLKLKYIQGFKFRHLAEILGVPEGTVRAKVYRAAAKLRERYNERWSSKTFDYPRKSN